MNTGWVDDADTYRIERLAIVTCGEAGDKNCRHAWNAAHPDDQVTVEEQQAFENAEFYPL